MADLTAPAADATVPSAALRERSLTRRLRAMPLRWRLLGVTLGLVAAALAVTALVISALLRVYLLNQAEQELKVYAASIASFEAAELSATQPRLPSGFTLRTIDLDTGQVRSLGEAVTEPDQADIPAMAANDPRVTDAAAFRVGSVGGDGQCIAPAQIAPA